MLEIVQLYFQFFIYFDYKFYVVQQEICVDKCMENEKFKYKFQFSYFF